jgi:hypothetical protein
MKTRKLLIVAGIAGTLVLIMYLKKREKSKRKLHRVAEEGYETAEDILFPKRKFLHLR